jgi:RNA polymerase sigma-70 factor (ECF subfamily)
MSAIPTVMTHVEKECSAAREPAHKERLSGLVERHFSDVWRFLRRLGVREDGVDDAAQDVFLVAARRIEEIRPGSEKSFLFGTALRTARTHRRRQAREIPDENVDPGLDMSPGPDERFDEQQKCRLAHELLDALDDDLRQVFVLYEIEGFTMQRIAELTEVPAGTVASRLRRARDEFQARLDRHRARLRGPR